MYVYMCMLIYVCVSTCMCKCVHVQFCMKTNVLMNERSISHLFSCKIEHVHTHTHQDGRRSKVTVGSSAV